MGWVEAICEAPGPCSWKETFSSPYPPEDLVSRYAPLMSITRLSLSRTVTFFFSSSSSSSSAAATPAAAVVDVVISSYPQFSLFSLGLFSFLSYYLSPSHSHTDFLAFSPHIPPSYSYRILPM